MPPARKRQKVAQPEESHVESDSDSDLAGAAETNDQINLAKLPVRKGEKQLPAEVRSKFPITTDEKKTTDVLAPKRGPLRAIDHDEADAIRIAHIQQLEAENQKLKDELANLRQCQVENQKLRARIQELEHDRNHALESESWPDNDGAGGADGPSPEREDSVQLLEAVNEPKSLLSVGLEPFDFTVARPVITPKRLASVVVVAVTASMAVSMDGTGSDYIRSSMISAR
jgi:hypothetical protein